VVKDHAEGGKISTIEIGSCIPSLIGDDADVVFWESQMNDHGDAVDHSVENHFRNSVTLPRRPLYHVMHAGKNGPESTPGVHDEQYGTKKKGKKAAFKNEDKCYQWLCGKNTKDIHDHDGGLLMEEYTDYGSGIMLFYPANGLRAVNTTKYEEFKKEYLYVSWHPGPTGHRVYAEMLSYHYLSAVLETLMDIKDLIDALTPRNQETVKPIEEMLEILEDPATTRNLPTDSVAKQCDPFCTNATESVCISGYKTLGKPRFSLQRWRRKEDENERGGEWVYNEWMGNPQALMLGEGGQGNNDIKEQWFTRSPNERISFIFEAKQHGFIAIEGQGPLDELVNEEEAVEIWLNAVDMESGEVLEGNGSKSKCVGEREKKKNKWWTLDNGIGCHINGLTAGQKYEVVIRSLKATDVSIKNIRVW